MQDYFLISGGWLAAAAITAFVYARLATFGAQSDAHHFEPKPLPMTRGRPRSPTFTMPGWILAPLAMGCVVAVVMTDFALAPEIDPAVPVTGSAQSVRMAEAPAPEPKRTLRRPRRAAARPVSQAAPGVRVAASPRVGAAPTAPASRPQPARRRSSAPAPKPSPALAPAAAAAAAVPTPTRAPVPEPSARAQPEPAPSQEPDHGGLPAHAAGAEKKRTVHPLSKSVPGRVHRPKAPVGRPRCACR